MIHIYIINGNKIIIGLTDTRAPFIFIVCIMIKSETEIEPTFVCFDDRTIIQKSQRKLVHRNSINYYIILMSILQVNNTYIKITVSLSFLWCNLSFGMKDDGQESHANAEACNPYLYIATVKCTYRASAVFVRVRLILIVKIHIRHTYVHIMYNIL